MYDIVIEFLCLFANFTVYTDTVTLPDDASVMTYRGHRVKKTLIRAKFSPQETTGQRYIYTGCGTGRLISKFKKQNKKNEKLFIIWNHDR